MKIKPLNIGGMCVAAILAMGMAQEAVRLTRIFKADESGTYAGDVKGELEGQALTASAKLTYKVSKLLEDGKAKAQLSVSDLRVSFGGVEESQDLEPLETTLDAMGLPDTLPTNDAGWIYTMAAFTQIMPAKETKVGESFEITWTNSTKEASIKGKGKLIEVAEVEGVKAAKMEFEVEFSPDGFPMPGSLKGTNWIELSTGRSVKSEGKIRVGAEMELDYKFNREKKA